MQDKYYSDRRDLVKWSVLLLLARKYRLQRILQIAYYRHSEFCQVEINGHREEIPPEILPFFRSFSNIVGLSQNPSISIFPDIFKDRRSYLKAAINFIAKFTTEHCAVFLDPDTGLEPERNANLSHVLDAEVREIWNAIPRGWLCAIYQHQTNRNGRPWIEEKKRQFASAIGMDTKQIGVGKAEEIANDVVLFHARKSNSERSSD